MEELNFEEIRKNIRAIRLECRYTQEYIADLIDMNVKSVKGTPKSALLQKKND